MMLYLQKRDELKMETVLAYFDETGDDGFVNSSSEDFVLTSIYTKTSNWQNNYNLMKNCRALLKEKFGFHSTVEMHTKDFLTDKNPYRNYNWSKEQKQQILISFVKCIADMDLNIVNVIIDKTKIKDSSYNILEHALTYNIQRIENSSNGKWNYIIITDKGRLAPMRKTARAIRAYNPIQSHFASDVINQPITGLIEDILEKDSSESYFIQICDFVSYFVHLYFKCVMNGKPLPARVQSVIDNQFVTRILVTLRYYGKINLQASKTNEYGLVIYPK